MAGPGGLATVFVVTKTIKPTRPWWQLLVRAGVLLALVLGAAYVTLPWWLPPSLVRQIVQDDLRRKLGLEVKVGSVSLSWVEGVHLRGLRIQEPVAFGQGALVDVSLVRAEFSPVNLLVHKRLEWLELVEPTVHVKVDAEGNVNLAALARLQSGEDQVRTGRISVRRGRVVIRLPEHSKALDVQVSDLQVLEGRVSSLGRVTLSAALLQEDHQAPIGLQMAAHPSDSPLAATASFNFSNVDLQQLALLELVKTPLKKLSGRCSGQLDLKINRQSVVDSFGLSVSIERLDVQPASGPHLPVIDQAGFSLAARYDPLEGNLELGSLTVRLPGVDLSGRLVANTQAGPSWEAIRELELSGELVPSRLAAVLTGQPQLPGELALDGPIALRTSARRQGDMLGMEFIADASACTVRRSEWTLKPAGRKLQAEMRGTLDRRTWQFAADQTTLLLGRNRFVGGGALSNIRTLVRDWTSDQHEWSAASVLDDLGNLNWAGSWEVHELDSLRELAGAAGELFNDVRLDGPLTGGWSLEHRDGLRLHANFALDASAKVTVGPRLVKPAGQAFSLALSGTIDPATAGLEALDIDCSLGEARLFVDRGYLRPALGRSPSAALVVDAGGKFEAQRVEALAASVPDLASVVREMRGRIEGGRFVFRLGEDVLRLHLTADLTELALSADSRLLKQTGQWASLWVDLLCDRRGGDQKNSLRAAWRSRQADLTASAVFGSAASADREGVRLALHAAIRDARCLAAIWPVLADQAQGRRLAGAMDIEADATWRRHALDLDLRCDADALEFSSTLPRRVKRPGIPLRLRLAGSLRTQDDRTSELDLDVFCLDVGRSRLRVGGSAVLAAPPGGVPIRLYPPPGLARADLSANVRMVIEDALCELLPELDAELRKQSLSGTLLAQVGLSGDRERLVMRIDADGDALASDRLQSIDLPDLRGALAPQPQASQPATQPALPIFATRSPPIPPDRLILAKPAGLPARLQVETTLLGDLSRLVLNHAQIRVGELYLMADAQADLGGPPGHWDALVPRSAHVAVWTQAAEQLHRVLPLLADYHVSGDFHVESEIDLAPAWPTSPLQARYVRLSCRNLRGRYERKDLLMRGTLLARSLCQGSDGKVRLGSLRSDDLELRAGENHVYLLLDLANLGDDASGNVQAMVDSIDDKDLMEWLAGEGSVQKRPGKLSAEESQALLVQGRRGIEIFRPLITRADVGVKFDLREVHTYDAIVGKYFDLNNLTGELSVRKGLVRADYRGGIYGGTLTGSAEVDFNRDRPVLATQTAIRDASANETIQAQLAKSFPNNTVLGRFNHEERLLKDLEAVLAGSLDARFRIRQRGTAKTVAVDGITRGRAAPLFITRIFPGLNLAEYRYRKMTAFAEYLDDGRAVNDMFFDGFQYDLFIEGETDAENIGRYQIGLVLLGSPQTAEWHHAYKQGRLPLLNFRARIEDGRMYDEEVKFLWPNETLFTIFLKNNIIYRLWAAGGKR
ncbi:MAG: AsmA family protein [Planctomycetes bacterium ADurb.Bin126]|nr:MAG: AsmA family protein [Planctomycetes bacterium ADurb.Bin126]